MKKIDISQIEQMDTVAPLWHKYPDRCEPQPAYLKLDAEGHLYAIWDAVVGRGILAEEYFGHRLLFEIPNDLTSSGIRALVRDTLPLLERIHAGHTIEWGGSNMVGVLSESADEAYSELVEFLKSKFEYDQHGYECADVWLAADGLLMEDVKELGITAETTDQQLFEIADRVREGLSPNEVLFWLGLILGGNSRLGM